MNINLHELQKAFALAQKMGESPNTPDVYRAQFLAIAHRIWMACGKHEPKETR